MGVTKTELIFRTLRQRIENGELEEGTRLMSLRLAADSFGVSKNIMVAVYEKLVANGLVSPRQGAGFFVERIAPSRAEPVNLRDARDAVSLLQTQLDRPYKTLVGDGRAPEEWMMNGWPALTLDPGQSSYGTAQGLPELREYIAAGQLSAGIEAGPAQVVTTFGANHGLDLVIRRFTKPGDTVLVDDPGYYPLFAKLKLCGVSVIGVPRRAIGPDPEALDDAAHRSGARMFFTQSLVQNPTGCSINLPTAHAILQVAERHDMVVVDDDPFIDLPGTEGTRLAALDQFRRVIQIGSYSKLMSPALRSGFILAENSIARSLTELKMVTTVVSSVYVERLVAEAIRGRRYEKHLNRFAKRLADSRRKGAERLRAMGFEVSGANAGGLYGWLSLPSGVEDLDLARRARAHGVFLAPGVLFKVSPGCRGTGLRVNWSRINDSRFYSFLQAETSAA